MVKKIRVIHLGVGGRGIWPVMQFKERDDFVSVAYVDINKEAIEKAQSITKVPSENCFSTLEEALRSVEADSVFVITPPQLHNKQCLQAIEAGKHVLVEKPFTLSLEEARDIVARAEEKGVKVIVAQNVRYAPVNRELSRLLREEVYGKPALGLMIKFGWRPNVHHSGKVRHSYLWERGVHDFDTILSFTDSEPKRVWGHSFNPSWSPYEHGAGTYTWIEFENGFTFGVICTFAARSGKNILQIECEKGSLEVDGDEIRVGRVDSEKEEIISVVEGPVAESILLDGFFKYVTEGIEPPFSGRQNLKTIALVEASGVGSDEGKIIDFKKYLEGQGGNSS